jgi:thiamine kinase-like enzyme
MEQGTAPSPKEVLAQIPEWADREVGVEVLRGGLAHHSWIVTVDGERYVLKILNRELEEFDIIIPLQQVIANTTLAGRTGVGAHVAHALHDVPAIVIEFIDGRTLVPEDMRKPEIQQRLTAQLRSLHAGEPFTNRLSIFDQLDRYMGIAAKFEVPMPDGMLELLPEVERIRTTLEADLPELKPCNNDLAPVNIMDDGRIRIIDYDLGGLNDVGFELGNIGAENEFDPDEMARFCELYYTEHRPRELARARLYLTMSNLTWSALFAALIGTVSDVADPAHDYWKEATDKFGRAQRDLTSEELGRLLQEAR